MNGDQIINLLAQCEKRQQAYILEKARLHKRYVDDATVLETLRALALQFDLPNHPVISVLIGGFCASESMQSTFATQRELLIAAFHIPMLKRFTVHKVGRIVNIAPSRDTALNYLGQNDQLLRTLFSNDDFIALLDSAQERQCTAEDVRRGAAAAFGVENLADAFGAVLIPV